MPAGAAVLTVEYKVNFLAPARGERFIARGRVTKPGRVLTVCTGEVVAVSDGGEKPVAAMLATMMTVEARADVPGGL
jgi:acyl-coenzyme A thioesterase PaaI-like protein